MAVELVRREHLGETRPAEEEREDEVGEMRRAEAADDRLRLAEGGVVAKGVRQDARLDDLRRGEECTGGESEPEPQSTRGELSPAREDGERPDGEGQSEQGEERLATEHEQRPEQRRAREAAPAHRRRLGRAVSSTAATSAGASAAAATVL